MPQKLTNKIIDQRIINANLKFPVQRIDNCIDSRTYIKFKYINFLCNHIWLTSPRMTYIGLGCPKCVINSRLGAKVKARMTNDIIDYKLQNRSIKRIGTYTDPKTTIEFMCLDALCNNRIWKATADNVLNKQQGCKDCANRLKRLSEDKVVLELKYRNIKILTKYINCRTDSKFECLKCHRDWTTQPYTIINGNNGCPHCNLIGTNETLIYDILKQHNIEFEYDFSIKKINSDEKKRFRIDFYFPIAKIALEYNGSQHYNIATFGSCSIEKAKIRLAKQIARDNYVDKFCEASGIKLFWIDGRKFKNYRLEQFIINEFIPNILGCKICN